MKLLPACLVLFALAYLLWTLVDAKDHTPDGLEALPLHKLPLANAAQAALGFFSGAWSQTSTNDLEIFVEDNRKINALVSWLLPEPIREALPDFFIGWFRNWLFGCILYLGLGGLWAYYVYYCFGSRFFEPGKVPEVGDILEQIKVAMQSMPGYALLPSVTEYIVEKGYTRAYPRVDRVGLGMSVVYFFTYMAIVEFGVYWSHRLLHVGWAYRYLHYDHHKYNKEHSLSPFAGLAFHPLDGVLQALPYTLTLFLVPMHYFTHLLLLFMTGVWTTNIHDCVDGFVEPIMGAGYHTIHHTSYKDNYGHYFIFMDWLFGTLITPEEYEERVKSCSRTTE